ncbi:TraB/GumN family protein [Mycetohabitans rhizoxinica]|uniref:TraB/GumN family protein n=1 Tax=Mycetohabitans rhizoxinica TaxID=412963 RepID=UPI0030D510EA
MLEWRRGHRARRNTGLAKRLAWQLAFGLLAGIASSAHALSGASMMQAPLGPPTVSIPAGQTDAATPPRQHGQPVPQADDGSAPSEPSTAQARVPRPAHMPFYVATKGALTLYLFGTLHVGDPADYPAEQPFRQPIIDALRTASRVAFELSPDDLVVSQDDVTRYGMCSYACLPRLLPADMWAKIVRRMRGNPAGLAAIRKTRPWLAAMLIETYDSLSAGLQTEYGSEPQLENLYVGRIVGLETRDEQIAAFTGLTLAEQREMLAQDLRQTPADNVSDVRILHALWCAGDADAMANWQARQSAKLARSPTLSRRIDDRIVYQRSERFVARMLLLAEPDRPIFVAIGALHLGGPKGVLALLRDRGFDVVPR